MALPGGFLLVSSRESAAITRECADHSPKTAGSLSAAFPWDKARRQTVITALCSLIDAARGRLFPSLLHIN